jgi:hypothetical protein
MKGPWNGLIGPLLFGEDTPKTAMIDSETNKHLRELADQIAGEQDRNVVAKLVAEFNRLIGEKIQSSDQKPQP